MSILAISPILFTAIGGVGSVIGGAIRSVIFTRVLTRSGIVQNIAKTTSPLFKGALLFGAANGAIGFASMRLKKKVKRDWTTNGSNIALGVDVLVLAITIASRYAVAKVSNRYFGTRITNRFIHILSVSDLISHTTPIRPSALIKWGFSMVVAARTLSVFMKTPLFKNTFLFGMISGAVSFTILRNYPKIHKLGKKGLGVKDLRILYISHVLFGLMALVSTYYIMKICNRYLKLKIPSNFIITTILLSIPSSLIAAYLNLIRHDFSGADINQIIKNSPSSAKKETILLFNQAKEILKYSEFDLVNISQVHSGRFPIHHERTVEAFKDLSGLLQTLGKIPDEEFDQMVNHLITFLKRHFLALPNGFIRSWLRGSSVETLLTETFERLVSDPTIITPLLDVINKELKVDINKAGVQFVLDDLLKRASQSTLDAFAIMDVKRNTTLFMTTKAISIYVCGSKKAEALPDFFPDDVKTHIKNLRTTISDRGMMQEFEVINEHLQAATTRQLTEVEIEDRNFDKDFFAFKSQLNEGSGVMTALNDLREVGSPLMQSKFAKNIFRIAAGELAPPAETVQVEEVLA